MHDPRSHSLIITALSYFEHWFRFNNECTDKIRYSIMKKGSEVGHFDTFEISRGLRMRLARRTRALNEGRTRRDLNVCDVKKHVILSPQSTNLVRVHKTLYYNSVLN